MKNLSIRRIVLSSIALLSGLFLLIGLTFNVIYFDTGLGEEVDSALKLKASGFSMLSFELPKALRSGMLSFGLLKDDVVEIFEILLSITSLLTLILSIGAIALAIVVFFRGSAKKYAKTLFAIFIVALIVATLHSVLAIVFTSISQAELDKLIEELQEDWGDYNSYDEFKFTTSAFVSIIIQAVLLTAYIVCAKTIKEPQVLKANGQTDSSAKGHKEDTTDRNLALKQLIQVELKIVDLLREYKNLYSSQVIAAADYVDKKVKLLRFAEKKVNASVGSLVAKCSFDGIVEAEKEIVNVLKEYERLLKEEIISNSDFLEKKVALLGYVIA